MNQILYSYEQNKDLTTKKHKVKNKNRTTFFKVQFTLCSIIAICITSYYGYILYENNKKENISQKLISNFNITSLYNEKQNYSATRTSFGNIYIAEGNNFNVIGLIEIKKININYPIISSYNNDLLKIAPCRFYGPMPNEVGNLCIAGHNYNSYKFFSRLKDLSNGDIITIFDLTR